MADFHLALRGIFLFFSWACGHAPCVRIARVLKRLRSGHPRWQSHLCDSWKDTWKSCAEMWVLLWTLVESPFDFIEFGQSLHHVGAAAAMIQGLGKSWEIVKRIVKRLKGDLTMVRDLKGARKGAGESLFTRSHTENSRGDVYKWLLGRFQLETTVQISTRRTINHRNIFNSRSQSNSQFNFYFQSHFCLGAPPWPAGGHFQETLMTFFRALPAPRSSWSCLVALEVIAGWQAEFDMFELPWRDELTEELQKLQNSISKQGLAPSLHLKEALWPISQGKDPAWEFLDFTKGQS